TELLNNNIQGIVELHLQDREINSPHIQFIGTEAEKAEYIIATILVNLKYETSIENAIGKKVILNHIMKLMISLGHKN
ncbi:hypothetical protein OLR75_10725, partial [Campylobacter jejuni]|nr:hypothetical protein [Campylobacter jejuni]